MVLPAYLRAKHQTHVQLGKYWNLAGKLPHTKRDTAQGRMTANKLAMK
jgi:hypothetical protein